jgi:hypothetical protein
VNQLNYFKEAARASYIQKPPILWYSYVSINTNMSYIQTTVVVQAPFLHGSVSIVSLGLFSGFARSHSDTPYSVGHLWSRDRLSQRSLPDNTQHSPDTYLCPGGIRTCKPAVVDPRLRMRGPWRRGEPLAQYVAQFWNSRKKN